MARKFKSTPAVFERDRLPQIEEHLLRSDNMLAAALDLVGQTSIIERRAAQSVMTLAQSEHIRAKELVAAMADERLA